MATYYGQVRGNRETTASRYGTTNSGNRASAQSYDGSVIVEMRNDKVTIEISDGSSFYGTTYFYGTLDELKNKLKGD